MALKQLWAALAAWARRAFTLGEDYDAFEGWDEDCWNAWDDWEQDFRQYTREHKWNSIGIKEEA